jgi:ribonuclease HII
MVYTAGLDEAGRGALAGPVVAAAVILGDTKNNTIYKDSKTISEQKRKELYIKLKSEALAIGVGIVSNLIIDEINILNATMLAMKKSALSLKIKPEEIIVDGNKTPDLPDYKNIKAIVKADALIPCVSAASIVAKVIRDEIMEKLSQTFGKYDFVQNKGYGTKNHYEQILTWGKCPVHRKSFNLTRQLGLF